MNAPEFCHCSDVHLPIGAISVWVDGVTHTDTACLGEAS